MIIHMVGGAGLVIQARPVCDAYDDLVSKLEKKPRVVYMTPVGYTFTQEMAQEFAKRRRTCDIMWAL